MAAKRLTPTSGIPVPPVPPVPVVPGLPGLTPPTTTVPPTTPKTTGPTRTTSNKVKTRLGTVEMEQLAGDPATRLKTEGRAIRDLIVNAPVGFTQFVVGAGIDIGKGALEVGSKLIPGVNFEAGRFRTTEDLISSFGRTGQFLGRALNPVRMAGAAIDPRNPKYDPLPPHYMEALEKNQSILPFIIEDFGNISMAGSIYSGVAKGAIRGVTLGEAAARAERTAASNAMASAAAGSAEAAEAAARMAKADAQLARIARTKDVLGKQADIGRNIARQADRVGALPFKPYTYTTRKLLGLYRDGIYLGPDGRYARWGQKASEGYAEQAQRLVDEGVSMDDERVVNLMNKSVKAGRRSVAREVMKQVRAATRDAENEQGSAVRAVTSQMMDPLHKDVIDPETNQPYGELSLDEAAAVLAVIGGNAQIINRLAARYNISPRVLALMGRYDFKEEYSLSQRAAEMARDFMNYSPENPGTLTPERYERLADAADKVSNVVFKAMIERAAAGYGRRNALDPAYMVPTPFVERLERNILESIKQAEKALRKERSKKTPNTAEVSRLEIILNDRYALYEAWGEVKEAGIFDLPVDHPDRIATLKGFVDQLPIELALDPTMYPASMRVPVEFYRRIRRAMAAKIIGDEGGPEPVGPDGEPTGPRLTPARSTREGAVEAELAKRERSKEAIERKIKQTAEQIDKLEVQHAKLVERILRYDVVDAYIGGASFIQIVGDFNLDGNLVRKILENSPVARTYRRLQNIRTRLAEIESQVGSANIDKIDAIMAEADRLNQEAAAAQAEYERVAALAEAERQQIEAEADALNEELYDLEEGMGDYEGQYEDAGGVVEDIYEDDGTIVVEDGEAPTGVIRDPYDVVKEIFGDEIDKRDKVASDETGKNAPNKKLATQFPELKQDITPQPTLPGSDFDVQISAKSRIGSSFLDGKTDVEHDKTVEMHLDDGSVEFHIFISGEKGVNAFNNVLQQIETTRRVLNDLLNGNYNEAAIASLVDQGFNDEVSILQIYSNDINPKRFTTPYITEITNETPREVIQNIIDGLDEAEHQIRSLATGETSKAPTLGLKPVKEEAPAKLTPVTKKRDVSEKTGLVHPMDVMEEMFGPQLEKIRELRQKNEDQRNSRKKKEYVDVPEPEIDLNLQPVNNEYTVKGTLILSGQDRMNSNDSFGIEVLGPTPRAGELGVRADIYVNYQYNKFDEALESIDDAIGELTKIIEGELDHRSFDAMASDVGGDWGGSTINVFDTTDPDFNILYDIGDLLRRGEAVDLTSVKQIISALEELKQQIVNVGTPGATTKTPGLKAPATPKPPVKTDFELVNEIFNTFGFSRRTDVGKMILNAFDESPVKVETVPDKIIEGQNKYIVKAINSVLPRGFHVFVAGNAPYFSDGFVVVPMETTTFKNVIIPIAPDGSGSYYFDKKGDAKADSSNVTRTSDSTPLQAIIEKYINPDGSLKEKGKPLQEVGRDISDGVVVVVLETADGERAYVPLERYQAIGKAQYYYTGEQPVLFDSAGQFGVVMSSKPALFEGGTKVDRLVSSLEGMKLTPSQFNGRMVKTVIEDFRNALGGTPREIDVTYQPGYEPKPKPLTPKKPKATKPSEVKPDDNIVDPVVREAVYTKEVVDAMAADAAAKMDAAQTFNEKIKAFQEFLDLSKKYDAEVARMAVELEPSRNARAKKKKIEEKIAKLRAALEELPEQAEAADAAIEAMLTNPFYDAYMNMDGSTPLDVALEGGYPSEIGGFEIESPGGENVRLIGPMYYPSGVPKEFFGGIETEVTREGFTGYEKLSSEHYRDGDRQVIFSLRELAIRMGRQVRQMAMNDKFRALVKQFGKSASEILGEEYTQGLYEQAVAYVDNMPIDALRVHVAEKISESLKTDMPISGIASPGPGVKNQKAVREFAINFEFGRLIGEAMRARGYEAIDPYAKIKDVIPAQNITARRAGETVADVDMDGPFDDPAPDDIVPETMFLPKGIKEKMAQVVSTKNEGAFEKAMRGAQKVTSFFKVGTLALSIPWQIGDLTSSMIISTMSGVDPRTLIKYMKEIKIQEYGEGPGSLRRMVDPNADWTNFRRGPLARLAGESGVQNLGQTLQERSYLYGEDLRPERGVVDRLTGGRLKFVSDAAAAVTGVSFKINETINKIVRHAFFLEQLDIQLRQRGQTLESLKNVENWQNDSKLREAVFDAARSANQWLGDYANLSVRERKYMGPLIPFWSWIRHIHGVFDLVAVNNPEALFYYMYLGTLADAEDDPLGLRRGGFNVFGGVASSNWLNPFADVVAGPIGSALLEQDLRPAGGSLGPVPRLLGGAVGYDVSRFGLIRRPSGTGGYSESGEQTSRSVLPLVGGSVSETAGFTAQQFPIVQRLLNLNPTPFENIPGTRIALGPVARFQTGEARLSSTTGRRIEQPGGRLASALRMFGGPLVPYRTDEQIAEVLSAARQKLITLDEIQRQRELQGAP